MQAPPARGPRTRTSKKYRHGNAEDRFRLVLIAFVFGAPRSDRGPSRAQERCHHGSAPNAQEIFANRTALRACFASPPGHASGHAAFSRRRPVAIVFAFHPCPLFSGVGCEREAYRFSPMSGFRVARIVREDARDRCIDGTRQSDPYGAHAQSASVDDRADRANMVGRKRRPGAKREAPAYRA